MVFLIDSLHVLGGLWYLKKPTSLWFQGCALNQYVALSTYMAPPDSGELSLQEGDVVEVVRYEAEGWWWVHHPATGQEGWMPCTYLKSTKRNSAYSSTVSSVSTASLGKVTALFCSSHNAPVA